ncbi:MAG: septum formation initiator family protein [bacterium]|nr:septum formation initiator family protein [bacterium]
MVAKISRFHKKKEVSTIKKVFGWSSLALIALLGLFLIFYNVRIYQKRAELEGRAAELREEIAQLSQQEENLKQQLEISSTEEYQERVLREQGLYQKPGEEVVTIVPFEEPEQKEQSIKKWWNPWTWGVR